MSVNICINEKQVTVPDNVTILEAARGIGTTIPTLCHLDKANEISACRVCVVEVKGMPTLKPACSTRVQEGMEIITDSERVRAARRKNLELLCYDHTMACTECPRGMDCRLRELCQEYEVDDAAFGQGYRRPMKDTSKPHLVRDNEKCILCRRCESTCRVTQTVNAIYVNGRAGGTTVGFGLPLNETQCVSCGQCIAACPTGALSVKDDTKEVWKALYDKKTRVIVSLSKDAAGGTAALFGDPEDENCAEKAAAMLRRMGADLVYDPAAYADEFGHEVRSALEKQCVSGKRPMILCTCFAARQFIERFYPQFKDNIVPISHRRNSLAARCREMWKDKEEKIFFVSIDGCVSAKTERSMQGSENTPDVSLTSRELFFMIRQACVSSFTAGQVWAELEGEPYDEMPFGSKARRAEAKPLFRDGTELIGEHELKTVEASGLGNVRQALEKIENYDLLRLSACPGGCAFGGGIPRVNCDPSRPFNNE